MAKKTSSKLEEALNALYTGNKVQDDIKQKINFLKKTLQVDMNVYCFSVEQMNQAEEEAVQLHALEREYLEREGLLNLSYV